MGIGLALLALCSIKTIFKIHSPTIQINHVLYIGGGGGDAAKGSTK
jgi:hypothetical protein